MNRSLSPVVTLISCLVMNCGMAAEAPLTPRLEQLNKEIAERPDDAMKLCDRGYAFTMLGMRAEALKDLERAAELAPKETNLVLSRVGWSYFNLKEYKLALETWLRSAAQSNYEQYYDLYTVALGYWGTGDGIRASAFYERAVEREPEFGEWQSLVSRTETWTWAEKQAIYQLFDAWRRGYRSVEQKK